MEASIQVDCDTENKYVMFVEVRLPTQLDGLMSENRELKERANSAKRAGAIKNKILEQISMLSL